MSRVKLEGFTDEEFNELVNPVNKRLVRDFLNQQQLSNQTLKQYKSSLYIFCRWVYDNLDNEDIPMLRPRDGLSYQNFLIEKGLSSSGIKFKRSTVSSLFNFIEVFWSDEYPKCRNIFNKAIPNVAHTKKKEKIPLTDKERAKIVKTLKRSGELQKLAFFLVAYSSAGRRSEIIQLKKEIVGYKEHENKEGKKQGFYLSHVVRGKGKGKNGKDIKLMLGKEAMDAIKDWLEQRDKTWDDDRCEYIFASKTKDGGKMISPNTTNLWVDQFGEIIGRKINPHLIRATRSTDIVVEDGKDVRFAQKLLNHESSETTTKHYIIRDDNDDVGGIFD